MWSNRELKKNSRGRRRQRRQNNKTNYTRQKEHVNMWNKADIRAVLLSCETPIAPFPRCLQNMVNISTIIVDLFSFRKTRWKQLNFNSVTEANTCSKQTTRIMSKYVYCCRRRRPLLFFLSSLMPLAAEHNNKTFTQAMLLNTELTSADDLKNERHELGHSKTYSLVNIQDKQIVTREN